MRSRSGQSVELLRCEAGVAAIDIGQGEKAGHRLCRLVVSGKEFLSNGLSESNGMARESLSDMAAIAPPS